MRFLTAVKSQNDKVVWVGRFFKDCIVQTLLPGTGAPPTRLGCLELHPTWP